jgi:hypothetical protein
MVKLNNPIRQLRSADEVMQELSERAPSLVDHCFMDRDWIWYCGPALSGNDNIPLRQHLKDLGFRFCPDGHTMPDGTTKGSWGNSCLKPMHAKRKKNLNHHRITPAEDPADQLRSLGL